MQALSLPLPTGVTLEYSEHGDPDGVPVVLLHGYSDSWRSYEPVLPHLPASIRALAVTLRGHGDSGKPETGYAVEDLAADVIALLDALDIPAAVVAGHSMGTIVAQRIAIDHPGRVAGIVLLAGAPSFSHLVELSAAVAELADPVAEEFAREFQESTVARPPVPGIIDTATAESRKLPARVWKAVHDGTLLPDLSEELGRIEAPALLIWGTRDQYVPAAERDALAAGIPQARRIDYAQAGHALHWEDPAGVADDLSAFVAAQLHSVT